MATDYLKRELISHTRKVCALYKHMSRDLEYWDIDLFEVRFKKLLLRQKFEQNKDIKDMRQAKAIYQAAKEKYEKQDIHPYHAHGQTWFPFSKEGISYGRDLESPDSVMDVYHPLEKARYPWYFAKREQMKDEYLRLWKKKMMKQDNAGESKAAESEKKPV